MRSIVDAQYFISQRTAATATEIARDLAYRLYTLCERKGWAEEAGYYNSLVVAWPSMASEVFELT